ncbi:MULTISPECIES: ATP-dependent DNA helicase [Gammaproteobacteria]|uniref:ATP-dependent DNA helicase n=1 Tax=Gammaproteobacteria TaxID=1236 RepID=UPI000DD03090|nr:MULTISPECIES: ATP-dependent DNA helicase [Gammaproteobacteria]RTE87611.1 ATP-dependent DNA helicase [Aliidiomarina sp. B3213]TCZ92604.1 ATP-dependent DNA helicase [Lysobacter sp. N42]
MTPIDKVFSENGVLSQALPHFSPRPSQLEMARAVHGLKKTGEQLVVEAETGTGKTFAYLAPALLKDGKVIVSTGTKNLQEQLFHRDMPALRDVLSPDKVVVLLKGRSNYLCLHRLEQAVRHPKNLREEGLAQLQSVRTWANKTRTGDMGELSSLPEDAIVLPQVTSTQSNCLGRECPHYEECYLVKARKEALEADVVVVNHHLFCADLALKETGFGELIPDADLVIFDEAHQLPEIASQYFSTSFSTRQISDLCQDVDVLYRTVLKDAKAVSQMAQQLERAARELRLAFSPDSERSSLRQVLAESSVSSALQNFEEQLDKFEVIAKTQVGRDKAFDQCIERVEFIRKQLQTITAVEEVGYSYWYETSKWHVSFNRTPLSVAEPFSKIMADHPARWVFTSATLTVNNQFHFFTDKLGLKNAQTLLLSSPFDYQRQAVLCLPRYLPEPNDRSMVNHLFTIAKQVIEANEGGTFLLFTSYRMLNLVAEKLEKETERTILVQGETSKRELLATFSEEGNAVLLGTSSFWEGVDVPGRALRCVLIDKLPFASPDDPLLQAMMEDCRRQNRDPFREIQIPQAVIAMKQGSGRLVRSVHDEGVLIVCDNRLVTRQYGQLFLNSLPNMKRTRDLNVALDFLRQAAPETKEVN